MKRFFAVILTLIVLLTMSLNLSVSATSNTYYLDELGLQVTFPPNYSVITRDTPASDPIFSDLGITKHELISQFESSGIYLNAITDTFGEEVVVTMIDSDAIADFSLLSDTALELLASMSLDEYTSYGFNVSKYDVYNHSQTKFIRLYFTDTGKTVHGLQYHTVCDGKAMNFTMRSYEGGISPKQEATIKTIVDSIKFGNKPPVADQGEDTASFVYTDKDTGATFTVPANWEQKEFTEDREIIDAKFVSTKEAGCVMIYGSVDMWEQLSPLDKIGYTRSDINNSAFTKSDIAEMYSVDADKITTVTYNGMQYFKCEDDFTAEVYGINVTLPMTQLIYIDNGWAYMFQFGNASTHKLYSDFESLIKSVQYPTFSNVGGVDSTNSSASDNSNTNTNSNVGSDTNPHVYPITNSDVALKTNSGSSTGIITAVVLLVAVAITIVSVLVYRKKKKTSCADYTPIYPTTMTDPSGNTVPTVYCTNCGEPLPADSSFCHMCGAKIIKE